MFNKPHHEIENDPNVWKEVARLIDEEIAGADRDNNLMTTSSGSVEEGPTSLTIVGEYPGFDGVIQRNPEF
jgi:hypothetical protein